jgi:hypothetical protein
MNQKIKVEVKGWEVEGELIADKHFYRFEVWEVREIATGNSFEDLTTALDCDLTLSEVAQIAATQAGIPYEIVLDMHFTG